MHFLVSYSVYTSRFFPKDPVAHVNNVESDVEDHEQCRSDVEDHEQ